MGLENLIFKDNDSAFEFAKSIYTDSSLEINTTYLCLVKNNMLNLKDRIQFSLEVASSNTRTISVYGFNDENWKDIKLGVLVYWRCENLIQETNFFNFEAVGTILAVIEPEFNPNMKTWIIEKDLRS